MKNGSSRPRPSVPTSYTYRRRIGHLGFQYSLTFYLEQSKYVWIFLLFVPSDETIVRLLVSIIPIKYRGSFTTVKIITKSKYKVIIPLIKP